MGVKIAAKMVAIMMHTDDGDFKFGAYPYETTEDKKRVVDIALEVEKERGVRTYITAV